MSVATLDLCSFATWDPAERTPIRLEDAAAVTALREPVLEHFRGDGKEVAGFPALASRLFGMAENRHWELEALVAVIERDPVVAAHVVEAANSAYYAGMYEVESLRDAVVRMGIREAARVAVTAAMRALFDPETRAVQKVFPALWEGLWRHSLRTAAAARWLSKRLGVGDPERAYLGGLLHDIGKTFTLRSFAALIVNGKIRGPVAERVAAELLEDAHMEVGVEVAVFWSFPEFLTSILMLHHEEALPAGEVDAHLVRVASGLDEFVHNPWYRDTLEAEVAGSCAALGIGPELLGELATQMSELAERGAVGL